MLSEFENPEKLDDFFKAVVDMIPSSNLDNSLHDDMKLAWEATLFDKPAEGIGSLLQHFYTYMIRTIFQYGKLYAML